MKKWTLILGIVIMVGFLLRGIGYDDYQDCKKKFDYIQEYRYKKDKTKKKDEFLEYKIIFRACLKIYFDFTNLGAQHFSRDTLHYAEWLLTKTDFLNVFLMVCDRMVRNIAFNPRLYDINIKTGKANDHFASRVNK